MSGQANRGSVGVCLLALFSVLQVERTAAQTATWRLGDHEHPWRLYPVSQIFDAGESFRPDYDWGASHAIEIVVDDDGATDEDPVDIIDADGLLSEDPADGLDNDGDGLVDEDGVDGQRDYDGDGLFGEDAAAAAIPLPMSIRRVVYEYDLEAADSGPLVFHWGDGAFVAHDTEGERVVAKPVSRLLVPSD